MSPFDNYVKYLISFIHVRTLLYVAILTLAIKYIFTKYGRDPRIVSFSKNFPGPYAWPIFGNSIEILLNGTDGVTKLFVRYFQEYGTNTFRLWFGKYLVVVLSNVDEIEAALTSSKTLSKPGFMDLSKDFFGHTMPFVDVPTWKKNRRNQQPFFLKKALELQIPNMNEFINKYVEALKVHVDGPEFDMYDDTTHSTFDVITKAYFDFEFSKEEKERLDFQNVISGGIAILSKVSLQAWLHYKFIRDLIYKKKLSVLRSRFQEVGKKIIADKFDPIKSRIEKADDLKNLKTENFATTFLSVLHGMEKEPGSKNLMCDEVSETIAGGTDLVATGTCSLILAIAMYPKIQDKLYEEIYQVFGDDDDRQADVSDLERLPYLEQTMKETLRRFILVSAIFRNVDEDAKIGKYVYPAGTVIMTNLSGLHFNPDFYPNPTEFNPDNFSPEAVEKRHKFSYVPFSAGPRNCIGKPFAELAIKLRAVSLLRKYRFYTTMKIEDVKMQPGFVPHSVNGYPVSIKLRKSSAGVK